jgi:hypothetical protein
VIVHRELLAAVGGFDAKLSHAEDVDLWIRLARRSPATASRRALVRYQHREGGLTRQLESRLAGDIALFERLGRDPELPAPLRRRARRRAALAHYKLAFGALRLGQGSEARRHLGPACQRWVKQEVALPTLRQERVSLVAEPALFALSTPGGGS